MAEQTQEKNSKTFRKSAHKSRGEYEARKTKERRQKKIAESKNHIFGNWVLTDGAALAVLEKIEEMAKKNIRIGKEAAIQWLLNEVYSRKHGII